MDYPVSQKGKLPAAVIGKAVLDELWLVSSREGQIHWTAIIGTDSDRLGKKRERSQKIVEDWVLLEAALTANAFDFLQITVEYPDKGTISLVYRNYDPAGGILIVAGQESDWVSTVFAKVEAVFSAVKDPFVTRLHNRYSSFVTHSIIPLIVAFFIVIGAAGLLIPGDIRRSGYIWWIVTGTIIANLKLGQILSDRLVSYLLIRYPYLRWQR